MKPPGSYAKRARLWAERGTHNIAGKVAKSKQQPLGQIEPRGARGVTGKGNNYSHPRVRACPPWLNLCANVLFRIGSLRLPPIAGYASQNCWSAAQRIRRRGYKEALDG